MVATALIATVLAGVIPRDAPPRRADLLERNRVHNEHAEQTLVQIIGWRDGHVLFWRSDHPVHREGGAWRLTWHDGERLRDVVAETFCETWTQYDPEVLDREFVPPERRRWR